MRKNTRFLYTALLLALAMPVVANTYNVTSTSDFPITGAGVSVNNANGVITGGAGNGFVTLRSAIAAANNVAGPHTINLLAATYTLSISGGAEGLTPAEIDKGDLDVTTSGVTIQGAGMNSTIINQTTGQARVLDVNVNFIGPFNFTIDGVTIQGGRANTSGNVEGGGMFSGSSTAGGIITVSNCRFLNNQQVGAGLGGGAICSTGGQLNVTNCVFGGTNPTDFNQATTSSGGAISYDGFGTAGIFNCTNTVFTNNKALSGASGGGAINVAAINLGTAAVTITGCTFTGNSAPNAGGGAITNESVSVTATKCTFLNNSANRGGAVRANGGSGTTVNFCRLVGNTATAAGGGHGLDGSVPVNGNDNWWGDNNIPTGSLGGSATATTRLQLKTSASPTTICNTPVGLGNTSNITTSFLTNSAGTAVSLANLVTVIGLPVTWSSTLGTLSGQQTTIQGNGNATALFTSIGTGGNATVSAQVDNVSASDALARVNITVNTIPTVTNPSNFTSCLGGTATFTSTITGTPAPAIQWRIGAVALVNGVQPSGSTVSGATTNTLTITNVQPGDAATNYNVQASNQCGLATSGNATLFVNQVTGGTVGSDQTICSGGDPAAFTESVASTGSGGLTYKWQSNTTSCVAIFTDIPGETSTTYDPPSGLAQTTYYRRVTISTQNAVPCTANSNCITVTVNTVTGGTVAADQTICSGGDPAAFTQTVASTGLGTLTYQWQSSTTSCAAGFSNIGTATAITYDPPAGLLVTTFYRRITTSLLTAVPCTANSNCITVTINDVTGGTVATDQTICSGGDPAVFTESVASTGTALTYQWQSSTTSCAAGFSNIGGATATTYDPPSGLTLTTFYRRVTTSTLNGVLCTANSNCITVTINNVTGGTVGSDQTICSGGDPAAFTESVASTGSGALTYQWQSSTTNCAGGFNPIGGATAATYDPPSGLTQTTYYRRVTTSTLPGVPCTTNSNCITVTVNGVTGGTIGSDQSLCSPADPAIIVQLVASTGSGALTYQWESSTTNCAAGFGPIGGATAISYDPPAGLTQTTYYRRVTTSTLPGVPCTANSNCITVTINVNTITRTSAPGTDAQVKPVNTPITPITYATTIAAGATYSGLPPGVNGNWAANVVTINGTPTAIGFYSYTVTLTGGCAGPPVTANGTINVTAVAPVTLTSFTGKLNSDKTVTLQWKVEQQQDILQYIVEESPDGIRYSGLGSVPASNGTVNIYNYIDGQVSTGYNYYRLKIIELSGKITYSHIVMVNLKAGITMMLYPNPVTGQLTIQQFGTIQNKTAVLSDEHGKILQRIKLTNLQQQVNMETYSSGVYIMKMEDGTVFKVVKD